MLLSLRRLRSMSSCLRCRCRQIPLSASSAGPTSIALSTSSPTSPSAPPTPPACAPAASAFSPPSPATPPALSSTSTSPATAPSASARRSGSEPKLTGCGLCLDCCDRQGGVFANAFFSAFGCCLDINPRFDVPDFQGSLFCGACARAHHCGPVT